MKKITLYVNRQLIYNNGRRHGKRNKRRKEKRYFQEKTAVIVISMLAVLVLAMTALAGCGGNGTQDSVSTTDSASTTDTLSGTTWKMVSVTEDGIEMSMEEYAEKTGQDAEQSLRFRDTEVDVIAGGEIEETFPYTCAGGALTVNGTFNGTVDDSKMTMETNDGLAVFEKKDQKEVSDSFQQVR